MAGAGQGCGRVVEEKTKTKTTPETLLEIFRIRDTLRKPRRFVVGTGDIVLAARCTLTMTLTGRRHATHLLNGRRSVL